MKSHKVLSATGSRHGQAIQERKTMISKVKILSGLVTTILFSSLAFCLDMWAIQVSDRYLRLEVGFAILLFLIPAFMRIYIRIRKRPGNGFGVGILTGYFIDLIIYIIMFYYLNTHGS